MFEQWEASSGWTTLVAEAPAPSVEHPEEAESGPGRAAMAPQGPPQHTCDTSPEGIPCPSVRILLGGLTLMGEPRPSHATPSYVCTGRPVCSRNQFGPSRK